MGTWREAFWSSSLEGGVQARHRRSGAYWWYEPDSLTSRPVVPGLELDQLLAEAERAVRQLNSGPGGEDLAGLARFLLRSEAIASSRIEGIAPAAKQVALAELATEEAVSGFPSQAEVVARNMTIVKEASSTLASAPAVTTDDIVKLHAALLADEPRHQGLRGVQNWIGGSDYHPLDADFVPPAPDRVPELLDDLCRYLNGATHSALVQAALVHAQFETIHPFTDGNGRMGRALIHSVLTRRGLTPTAILPISLVFATFRDEYVRGLTAYRYDAQPGTPEAEQGIQRWLTTFADACLRACRQADELRQQVGELRAEWEARLEDQRNAAGRRRSLRSDSATSLILRDLPSTPVLTSASVERIHGVSAAAASNALAELKAAGIVSERSAGRRVRAYTADEVLDLITATERRLASTKFDTRVSPPNRAVPAPPS